MFGSKALVLLFLCIIPLSPSRGLGERVSRYPIPDDSSLKRLQPVADAKRTTATSPTSCDAFSSGSPLLFSSGRGGNGPLARGIRRQ